MLNAVSLSGGSRMKSLFKKVFYPKAELEDRFPWCKGKWWLLPAAWFARVFYAVRIHGKEIRSWSKGTSPVTKEAATEQRRMLSRFGIQSK